MKLKDALNIHEGDTVIVKRTKEQLQVIEIEVTPSKYTGNNMTCVDFHLTDGDWYGYKQVKISAQKA